VAGTAVIGSRENITMKKKEKSRSQLIKELVHITDEELSDEELIHALIAQKVTVSDSDSGRTLGQRAADAVAKFAGSWSFIFSFLAGMCVWMVINVLMGAKAFDSYPFILLNLVLSCIAAVQAPLIMMSQNRQEAKDRERAENDYKVNLKNEIVIDDLHEKLDQIIRNQKSITDELKKMKSEINMPADNGTKN
jgi:uncharacterized membrane protein